MSKHNGQTGCFTVYSMMETFDVKILLPISGTVEL